MSRRVWNDNRSQGSTEGRNRGDGWGNSGAVPSSGGVFDRLGRPPTQQNSDQRSQQSYNNPPRGGGGRGRGGDQYAYNRQGQGRSGGNYNDPRSGGQGAYGQRNAQYSGGWGAGGGHGGNQNRFAALGDGGGDRSGQGGRHDSQDPRKDAGQSASRPDWRQVMRHDTQTEQPKWPFTCYAHERDGPNDLEGDVSFEELRWAQQQAAGQGTSPAMLSGPFEKAVVQRQQQIQAMLKGNRPPSKGGPSIPPLQLPMYSQQVPASPATPFGQVVSAFGAGSARHASTGGFGAQPVPAFGQSGGFQGTKPLFGTGGGGFGPSTFGNAQGPQAPAFGAPAFGSGAAKPVVASSFGSNQGGASAVGGGFIPGQGHEMSPATQPATPGAGGAQPNNSQVHDTSANPWQSTQFFRGHIPEEPPPAMYSH